MPVSIKKLLQNSQKELCQKNTVLIQIVPTELQAVKNKSQTPYQLSKMIFVNEGGKDVFQSHLTVMGKNSEGC